MYRAGSLTGNEKGTDKSEKKAFMSFSSLLHTSTKPDVNHISLTKGTAVNRDQSFGQQRGTARNRPEIKINRQIQYRLVMKPNVLLK